MARALSKALAQAIGWVVLASFWLADDHFPVVSCQAFQQPKVALI